MKNKPDATQLTSVSFHTHTPVAVTHSSKTLLIVN